MTNTIFGQPPLLAFIVIVAAVAITAGLNVLLHPLLVRYALARPNARSSHRKPTPQGGGIAVVVATLGIVGAVLLVRPDLSASTPHILPLFAATVLLAIVGAVDDIRVIGVAPRLLLQTLAVGAVIIALPDDLRLFAQLPHWLERALLILAGLWFINLVNFMDGIDWMTVAEMVPICGALAVLGLIGVVPPAVFLLALALCGAMLGFAPFNRPVAKLFLGDVGSLPIGLMVGWMIVSLAGRGHLAAALLLPLYYLADATLTLLRRLLKGERVTQAHRTHFYQRATDHGFSVLAVVAHVFAINVLLALLAIATILWPVGPVSIGALVVGAGAVAWLLMAFAPGKAVG